MHLDLRLLIFSILLYWLSIYLIPDQVSPFCPYKTEIISRLFATDKA